jgi:putative transposase
MKFRAIQAEKASYPVALMCACLSVSRSGYYAWESRPESDRVLDDKRMAGEVEAVFKTSRRTYGYPRIYRDLQNKGRRIGRHRVARLMREQGLQSIHRRRFRVATTQADPGHQAAENTLDRQFKVEKPNDVWVADITCVPTAEGWLYLALLVDLYARRIVGWSMGDHMRTELPLDAWKMGLSRRGAPRLHHSDRGSQYTSHAYRGELEAAGTRVSMSRKGECHDNAVAESVFATIKVELVHRQKFATRAAARAALFEYMEVFYNRNPPALDPGYQTPVDFEKQTSGDLVG